MKSLSDRAIELVIEAWETGLSVGEATQALRMDRAFIARIYAQKDQKLSEWAKDVSVRSRLRREADLSDDPDGVVRAFTRKEQSHDDTKAVG